MGHAQVLRVSGRRNGYFNPERMRESRFSENRTSSWDLATPLLVRVYDCSEDTVISFLS
jgi:hypothetical protein